VPLTGVQPALADSPISTDGRARPRQTAAASTTPFVEMTGSSARPGLSFERLYADHFRGTWRMLKRLGVHELHLDDAAQEVFLTAWRRLSEFEGRSSERTWLYGIAIRVASDWRRRKQKANELPASTGVARGDPEGAAQHKEAVEQLHALLSQMDDEKREAFVLVELEQLSAPEISEALGLNLNTVYTRIRAARLQFNALVDASKRGSR
jgi:RNA polymerase sigma-70 factor, ECF subfamily